MSTEAGIHARWTGHDDLESLCPATNFQTGYIQPVEGTPIPSTLPWVRLERVPGTQNRRTSSGSQSRAANYEFTIWANDLNQAKSIANAIDARYGRTDFTYSGGRVIDMKEIDRVETRMDEGSWMIAQTYQVRTVEP